MLQFSKLNTRTNFAMTFSSYRAKRWIDVFLCVFLINFCVRCAGASNNDNEIIKSSISEANNCHVHCDSPSTTTKRSCFLCDDSISTSSSQSIRRKNTCTMYCDFVSSCNNSIITGSGLGCCNTIIIAPSTDTSIINMTLDNINSKQITIKTSSSSFINSTIVIHPNTHELDIDSKMFANNNVVSLETQKAATIRTNACNNSKHEQKTQATQATLKTDNFLFQLFGDTMVFVNNTISVNPKSILVNVNDKLRDDMLFEENTLYSKYGHGVIFNKVRKVLFFVLASHFDPFDPFPNCGKFVIFAF